MLPYVALLIFLGIANWLATTILVEAEITRDYRDWIGKKYDYANEHPRSRSAWGWYKLKYLVGCHLCTGIWVAIVMAAFVPSVIATPVVGFGLTALIIKGIGHMVLVLHKLGEATSNMANARAESDRYAVEIARTTHERFQERMNNGGRFDRISQSR